MRFGRVLTYKDLDEARRLIGKKVVASDFYALICDDDTACDCVHDTLKAVHAEDDCPFECNTIYSTQFIREILDEAKYEPYDLSDKKVRDSLRGRWFRDEYGNEVPVDHFDYHERRTVNVWYVNGYSPRTFLEKCVWLDDGTPCGRMVDCEPGIPMTRDGKEDEK